jgi:tetratricopeptide (TPR) repeat protein
LNAPTGVDWTAALLVLAAGLVLGTVLVWKVLARARLRTADASGLPADDLSRRDLQGKRDALVAQLRELEDTAAKRTPEQLARERYDLELRTAQVLLALDAATPAVAAAAAGPSASPLSAAAGRPAAPGPTAPPDSRAALRGFLWGTGSAVAVGLLLFFLYAQAKPREEGGSLTGDVPKPGAGGGAAGPASSGPPDAEEARIQEAIARNPDDLEARMALTRLYLGRQDMMGVWNETKAILERSPGHPPALAYQALVRLAMGQGDKAEELLKQAIAADPNLIDAYVHLALVYVRLGRTKDAEGAIANAGRRFPEQAPSLQRLLAELQQGQPDAPPAGEEDPHAGIGTPSRDASTGRTAAGGGARPPAGPGATSASGRRITGFVELDPSLQAPAGAVLFVFVREAGFGAGPPLAARRLPATSFPVAFEIGEEDAMMGQPFPDALLVEARLDGDGDPTTRPPTDPRARVDDVKTGSTGVKLVLKRAS